MKKLIWIAAIAVVATGTATPGAAKPRMMHHAHHAARMSHPESVSIDGKDYKVCSAAVQDDCINPRQAKLGFGNMPTDTYDPARSEAKKPQ
jgi:Flp pilus assembly protein TadD